MNKNTFKAAMLSMIIIVSSFYIQSRFFSNKGSTSNTQTEGIENSASEDVGLVAPIPRNNDDSNLNSGIKEFPTIEEKIIKVSTNRLQAVFSSKNAVIISLQRKNIINNNIVQVELIPPVESPSAFRIFLSDNYKRSNSPDVYFDVSKPRSGVIDFTRSFKINTGQEFILRKRYIFKDDEDLFELQIKITNKKNEILRLGDIAYTLVYGPQLGPVEEVVEDQRSKRVSQRWFVTYQSRKVKRINLKPGASRTFDDQYKWTGISGRYFSMIVLTNSARYTTEFSASRVKSLRTGAQLAYMRSQIQSSAVEDKFRIYIGPNSISNFDRYNSDKNNNFGIVNAQFNKIIPSRLLGFLENILKWVLSLFYSLVSNYGVAIIMLTIVVRLITLPIMNKSKRNSEKMKALGPKIQRIKEKYPNDNAKQTEEMMALYKREKFSPFSSFMPLLIQIPFFLAMYRVIYESVELWRQPFIGWINDLSAPDVLITFNGFTVPVINWTGIHLLPIIMLGTQFFSSLIMLKQQNQPTAPGTGKHMMLFFSFGFPFIIFFALYNSPSGLIIYWIVSNVFTVIAMMDFKKKTTSENSGKTKL